MRDDDTRLQELEDKVDALTTELARYKGFIGGVLFVVTALWAFVELVFPYFVTLLKRVS
jgi:hypothetical protein